MNPIRRIALFAVAACLPLAASAQTQPAPQPKACTNVKLTTSMGPIVIELDKAKARSAWTTS